MHLAAEQRVDGTIQRFCRGIIKSHLGSRPHDCRNSGLVSDTENPKPMMENANVERIQSKHVRLRNFDGVNDAVPAISFADANDALVRDRLNDSAGSPCFYPMLQRSGASIGTVTGVI